MYLILKICDFDKLELVSLETRPEYVEDWELKTLKHVLGNNVKLEVGIGYETYDPGLRNKVLKKGLSIESLRRLMQMLSDNDSVLKAYLMLKPHYSLSEEEGVVEAINGLKELASLGDEFKVEVSAHINPTYIAEGCGLTDEMIKFGYQPPELCSLIEVLIAADKLHMPVYAGLDDEGVAIEGGTFRHKELDKDKAVKALQDFNRHQNIDKMLIESGYKNK